jgi:hypothetical protein
MRTSEIAALDVPASYWLPGQFSAKATREAKPPAGVGVRAGGSSTMAALRPRRLLIPLLLLALAAPASASAATPVSYQAILQQVKSGALQRAVINRANRHIEIKFRDATEWIATYPPRAQPLLQRVLRERHVHVIFARRHHPRAKPAKVHHHLRYIAAGVLGALIVIGGGLVLYSRRRAPGAPEGAKPAPEA